jgi:hypothetical protein
MVRMVENWARVEGTVVAVSDVGDPSGFLQVGIRVHALGGVEGSPQLLRAMPGEVVPVLMDPDLVKKLDVRQGCRVEADVRRADLQRSFVHPDRIHVQPPGPTQPGPPDPPAEAG